MELGKSRREGDQGLYTNSLPITCPQPHPLALEPCRSWQIAEIASTWMISWCLYLAAHCSDHSEPNPLFARSGDLPVQSEGCDVSRLSIQIRNAKENFFGVVFFRWSATEIRH